MPSYTKKRRQTRRTRKSRGGRRIDFNNDAVYLKNVYDKSTFNKILEYTNQIKSSDMVHDPKATGRGMYVINNKHPIIPIICSSELINKVRKITNNPKLKPCLEIPIEYRKYVIGSYMDWHKDTQMLQNQLQYECVITLTNNSDSFTLLKYDSGIKKMVTEPNTLLVVRANGISHKVTPLTKGERTILKLVFAE